MVLPDFAGPLAVARCSKKRPADLVIVSDGDHGLHRQFPDNPVVRVRPDVRAREYDFSFLVDLDVEIATDGPDRRATALARSILLSHPRYLRVWFLDTDEWIRVFAWGQLDVRPENRWLCGAPYPTHRGSHLETHRRHF